MKQVDWEKAVLKSGKIGNGQCVALVRDKLVRVDGLPKFIVPPDSDAEEWWKKAPDKHFIKRKGGVPWEGSIVIIKTPDPHDVNHVAVVRKGATSSTIPVIEQNWAVKKKVTLGKHRNKDIRWLFPKKQL